MKIFENFRIAFLCLAIIWVGFILDSLLPVDLRMLGIRPRDINGLWGIVLTPFLHAGLHHLLANTGALFVLLTASLAFSRKLSGIALTVVVVMGGGLVWVFGETGTIHIGASGLVFGLIGFLLFMGFFRREWRAFLVSFFVFIFYGGALISLFEASPGISWVGHFFGFVSGVFAAWWTRTWRAPRR